MNHMGPTRGLEGVAAGFYPASPCRTWTWPELSQPASAPARNRDAAGASSARSVSPLVCGRVHRGDRGSSRRQQLESCAAGHRVRHRPPARPWCLARSHRLFLHRLHALSVPRRRLSLSLSLTHTLTLTLTLTLKPPHHHIIKIIQEIFGSVSALSPSLPLLSLPLSLQSYFLPPSFVHYLSSASHTFPHSLLSLLLRERQTERERDRERERRRRKRERRERFFF